MPDIMHPLHTYIAASVAEKLRDRRVVVWYDPRGEFLPFINELRGQPAHAALADSRVEMVEIQGQNTALCCYVGSFFAVRAAVEPLVALDRPKPLLVYVAGAARDPRRSVLLELEVGGETYEPQLKRLARNVLRQFHSDGIIDQLLASEQLTYDDIVVLVKNATGSGNGSSVLKLIFPGARDNATLIAAWITDPTTDQLIREKAASLELYKLIGTRLGLQLDPTVSLDEARSRLLRYLLVGEFRADLSGPPPLSVGMIPAPATKEQHSFLREVTATLRRLHPDRYVELADQVEAELSLASAGIAAANLGLIDTFRFEERVLLEYCDSLLAQGTHAQTLELAAARRQNFWVDRDALRQAQWQVCQLAAELGQVCDAIHGELDRIGSRPDDWVAAYTRDGGWYRMDLFQRQLESWVAGMGEEPVLVRGLTTVRQAHDRLSQRMAEAFTRALRGARWHIESVRAQTRIYADMVQPRPGSIVAYVLVDALRFEMGQELVSQLAPLGEHTCTPAIAAIPSITKIGMAALLPDAAAGFNLTEEKGKLAARIDDTLLLDLTARQRLFKARIPQMVDLDLGELLALSKQKLEHRLKDAPLVVVRSQEIDTLGESGNTLLARQVMDTVVGNVARAARKLASAGVTQIVITADHGHLFALERGDDMKTESPGGSGQIELHRRCWVGRGGSTPPGAVRVTGAELGYATDVDFIFPTGLGVFKAGGGLAYHHGGLSLQELVVPVIQVRVPRRTAVQTSDTRVLIGKEPDVLRNRTLGIELTLIGMFTEELAVRPVLLSGTEQVGYAGMAYGAAFDRTTGCVTLKRSETANVGMMLTRDSCAIVRIVVLHPVTDAVLGQTDDIRVELGL